MPDDETAIRSVEVFRAMSCDALATPGTAGEGGQDRCERDGDAQERTSARRIRSGAVSGTDPDVERFLLLLAGAAARRGPSTPTAAISRRCGLPRRRRSATATTDELERWVATMRADGLAPSTIARASPRCARTSATSSLIGARTDNPAAADRGYRADRARCPARSRPPRPSG